jgi:hypothetical protein
LYYTDTAAANGMDVIVIVSGLQVEQQAPKDTRTLRT